MPPVLSIKGLSKSYKGGLQALKTVDLEIERGEIFALLGPNGAGKTTLINAVCGIITPTTGEIIAAGFDTRKDYRSARSLIGLVPQEMHIDIFETVWAVTTYSRGLFGLPPNNALVEQVLRDLSLWEKKDTKLQALSGGMKRRVLIAKALVHEPEILFLDEPTAGVDVELRRQLWAYVRKINAEGVTILLTTHYLEEAQELCDTIAIMNRGQVIACEPTPQLLRRLDTRNVVVTPEHPQATPPALNGFEVHARPNGAFAVTYRKGQSSVEQVLAAVRAAGITISDITTEDPDLEDVFLALTYNDTAQVSPTKD